MLAPERKSVLKAARHESFYIKADGTKGTRIVVRYKCAHCKELHPEKNVQVDHKNPIGKQPPWPPTGKGEWDRWILAVFCDLKNLQVLCKPCHKKKSAQEKKEGKYE